ncbi:MAG: CRISPR-associated endonuclease Cas1 [Minicystis sp.]
MNEATHPPPARPKDRLVIAGDPPALVPARMINETLYCERLLYLEWAQGEFEDNAFTVEGRVVHTRADQPGGSLPPVPEEAETEKTTTGEGDTNAREERPYQARSVWLSSEKLGITAKIDIVEGDEAGRVLPIEYKRGAAPDLPEGAYPPERAQVCAQVLLLREHGYLCEGGAIYFAASRKRVPIAVDEALIALTLRAVARAREVTARAVMPPPLDDSPKCNGCSLIGICLPDETVLLQRLEGRAVKEDEPPPPDPSGEMEGPLEADPWGLVGTVQPELEIRRLHPARDDKLPVYVQEQGARVSLEGDRLILKGRTLGRVEARLANTSQVSLLGNVQITTQALRALLARDIPLSFFTSGGFYLGRASGHDSNNVELRLAQHRAATDPAVCLGLARGLVASKIRNSRTLLRRNLSEPDPVVVFELEQLARKSEQAASLESLLGLEGSAARAYFKAFSGMLKGDEAVHATFDMEGRNRRPPRDPINALLSLAYALLAKDFTVVLGMVGLDPLLGFFHQPRFGRPALALDLMEEFRPLVADSVVLGAINTGVITGEDFVRAAGSTALKPAGRKRFLLAYERRMDQLVTHPVFGYRISYRRVLEVQARLLGRMLLGELASYPAFRTR